jgi:single-strand DNA-binding protein
MSNNISFTGRLGRDSELKQVGQNDLLEFNVGNNVGFGDKKSTNWFKCSVWGNRAVTLEQYLTKGQEVFVCGELTLREYENKEGIKKISPEIRVNSVDFVGGKKEGGESSPEQRRSSTSQSRPETEEDMPF